MTARHSSYLWVRCIYRQNDNASKMKGLWFSARFLSILLQTGNRPVSSSNSCLKTNNYVLVNYQPRKGQHSFNPQELFPEYQILLAFFRLENMPYFLRTIKICLYALYNLRILLYIIVLSISLYYNLRVLFLICR